MFWLLCLLMPTITKTIGAAGDYADPAAAATAFNAGTIAGASAGDDIVFNIIDNAAFDSLFAITANPTGYLSYTLTVDPTVRHDGTYGSGARIAISTTQRSACSDSVTALDGTIEWLEVTTSGSGKLAGGIEFTAGFSSGKTKTARNNLIHDNGGHSTTPFRTGGICGSLGSAECPMTCNCNVHNNLIDNWKSGSTVSAHGISGATNTNGATQTIENNTVDNIDVTGGTSGTVRGIRCIAGATSNKTVKNNSCTLIGLNTTTGTKTDFSCSGTGMTQDHNASSDSTATGTGSLTSIVRGNEFTDPDNGDFTLASGSSLFEAGTDLGTTPTGVNIDLTGRNRDSEGDVWSIGGYQLEAGVASSTIDLTTPVAYRTYQRNGSDQADIVVSGTYSSGTVSSIEYRLDGASWLTLDNSLSGGMFSGTISGVGTGVHIIDVRLNDETDITDTVSNVLVGDVILVIGQSNAAGRLTNDQSYTHASLKAAMYDGSWAELTDSFAASGSTGSPWPLLATQWLDGAAVPLAVMNKAGSGLSITNFWNSTAQANWTTAKSTVTNSGVNGLAAVLIDIGETDAINDMAEATFRTHLDGLAADVQSTYGCPLIVAHTGTTTGIDADDDLDNIREAQISAWNDNANVEAGPMGYDRAGLHWESDAEGLVIAGRWWLACEAALFAGPNERGPQIVSAIENDIRDTVYLTVDQTLTTDAAIDTDSFIVTDDATPATITAASCNGTTVTLTLSAPLSGSATLVTFATGNDAAGNDVPDVTVTLPTGSTVSLPMEPFIDFTVNQTTTGGPRIRGLMSGGMMALMIAATIGILCLVRKLV